MSAGASSTQAQALSRAKASQEESGGERGVGGGEAPAAAAGGAEGAGCMAVLSAASGPDTSFDMRVNRLMQACLLG